MAVDEKEWTIMVYMAGDNNLSEDMITGLKGMMCVGNKANINLVALYDGSYPSIPIKFYEFSKPGIPSPSNGRKHRLEDFKVSLEELQSAHTTTIVTTARNDLFELKDFVSKIIKKYPANKYALILSGHSDGIIGKRLLPDEDSEVSLGLMSLGKILKKVLPKDSEGNEKKIDLIGFDGCLMGMLEVGYELKDVAKVMVASQGNIPTTGWDYEEILADLIKAKGRIDEKKFAASIVRNYVNFNEDYAISGRSVNISACNLEELNKKESLYDIIQNLAKILHNLLILPVEVEEGVSKELADENKLIQEKFIDWMTLSHYQSQTFMHNQAVDIIDFIYNLLLNYAKWLRENEILGAAQLEEGTNKTDNKTVNKIQKRISSIFESFVEINKAIREENKKYILASCSVGAEYQFSQGVSLFFPWTKMALNMINKRYSSLKFNRTKHWLNFISRLTDLTIREKREEPRFDKNFESLLNLSYDELLHKEVGGKEVGGKEVGGKEVGGKVNIEEFYLYFSQIRNYKSDVFEKNCIDKTSFI